MSNILSEEFSTPPFSKIRTADYIPAIETAISNALKEIDEITDNHELPTFENTIEALENSGKHLDRVSGVFYALLSADADNDMMDASVRISAMTSDFSTALRS